MERFSDLRGFRTLPAAARGEVDADAHALTVAKGQVLFVEGQPATAVWAVEKGLIHILKSGPNGAEIILEVIAPGELFGAIVAIQDRAYPASAVVAEGGSVWQLGAATARSLCQRYPSLRAAIFEEVSGRLRSAHDRMRSIALERVEQRLARMLVTLSEKIGQGEEKQTLKITRHELAEMIGTTVETAIRITSSWQRAGWIASARNELTILDGNRLRQVASASNEVQR
jgi:CRP/FNR family transcriptional regulator, nitrogen oxide reductase regulator